MRLSYDHKKRVFVMFFVFLILLTLYMLRSYFGAIFIGGLLAYFLTPWYTKLLGVVKRPLLAQSIIAFSTILLILLLITVFIFPVVGQAEILYDHSDEYILTLTSVVEECSNSISPAFWCQFVEKMEIDKIKQKAKDVAGQVGIFITQGALDILKFIASFALFIVIMGFSLFYFLGHGRDVTQHVSTLLPLDESHKKKILERFEETIRAVVGGNIVTALLEGILAGIIFFCTAIPFSFLLGMVVAIAALIPLVGAPVVWIPVTLYLIFNGSYAKAIIVALFSFIVLGAIDNFLKPKLIGDKIKMSSFAIFLGVLGGISVFGILGIFVGPIIVALLVTCVDIYRELK